MVEPISRRSLMQKAAQSAVAMSALSYGRILGANDRIQIGQIGCGNRGAGLRRMLKASSQAHPNIDLRSVCDLWSVNRQRGADHVQTLFGARPKTYQYSEEMLADRDLDAVIVSTGDHQHARILAEVVKAGKDCYCEKPMANTLEDAKLARDTVKASGRVVQMGSQWLSDPYQQKVRELVRGGKIGKVVSISQNWNFNGPRWHVPKDENVATIREQDTDWNRWLLGRPSRPFDPRVYFEFRIFRTSPAASPISGTATGPASRTSIWTPSSPTRPSRWAASSPGTTSARTRILFSASPRSPRRKCSTPTRRRSGTGMATTRSSAGRAARCIHLAARAARSGGFCRRPRASGARIRCST